MSRPTRQRKEEVRGRSKAQARYDHENEPACEYRFYSEHLLCSHLTDETYRDRYDDLSPIPCHRSPSLKPFVQVANQRRCIRAASQVLQEPSCGFRGLCRCHALPLSNSGSPCQSFTRARCVSRTS